MRILSTILSLSLLSAVSAFAQPTITNAEDFSLGLGLKFQLCVPQNINWGTAGANQTWDYSGLQLASDTVTEKMVAPSSTTHGNEFPGANLVEKYSDGRFVYVNKTATQNYLLGFADTANDVYMHYTDPMLFAKRPITYMDTYTDTYTTSYTAAGFDFSGKGQCTVTADGYGTLILPNGTHNNVLRLRILETQQDTILQFGTMVNVTSTIHVWFDGVHTSALLKLDSTHASNVSQVEVSYLLNEGVGIKENAMRQTLHVYPNPATDRVYITTADKGDISVLNSLGQVVKTSAAVKGITEVPTGDLQNGIYYVVYHSNTGTATSKIVISK